MGIAAEATSGAPHAGDPRRSGRGDTDCVVILLDVTFGLLPDMSRVWRMKRDQR